jgi:hypothetical protein
VVRPRDWASAYADAVRGAVAEWRRECRRIGAGYHRITTDTPFGPALREVLVRPGLA